MAEFDWKTEVAQIRIKEEARWDQLRAEAQARQASYAADVASVVEHRKDVTEQHGQYVQAINRLAAAVEKISE